MLKKLIKFTSLIKKMSAPRKRRAAISLSPDEAKLLLFQLQEIRKIKQALIEEGKETENVDDLVALEKELRALSLKETQIVGLLQTEKKV